MRHCLRLHFQCPPMSLFFGCQASFATQRVANEGLAPFLFWYIPFMRWIFEALAVPGPHFQEVHIDCGICRVSPPVHREESFDSSSKCCQFSPFLSGFALGAMIRMGHNLDSLSGLKKGLFQVTRLGLLHPLEHRRDRKALCLNFDTSTGGCHIWQQRPPICFSFFCGSQYPDGARVYSRLEKWLLQSEAELLKHWFDQSIDDPELWDQWVHWMEEDPQIEKLPQALLFEKGESVEEYFKKMHETLKTPEFEEVLSRLNRQWNLGLAREPRLC